MMMKFYHNKRYQSILASLLLMLATSVLSDMSENFTTGIELFNQGQFHQALDYFKTVEQVSDSSVALDYNLASTYYQLAQYDQSRIYFLRLTTVADMRELADYNLGLIAIKQKDNDLANRLFSRIVQQGRDQKLIELSLTQLVDVQALLPEIKDKRLIGLLAGSVGYDSNLSLVPDSLTSELSELFYDLYASIDYRISGEDREGWFVDASIFTIDFDGSNAFDERQTRMGLTRTWGKQQWAHGLGLSLTNNALAGSEYLSSFRLLSENTWRANRDERYYIDYSVESVESEQDEFNYLDGSMQRLTTGYIRYTDSSTLELYYELELNNRSDLITSSFSYDYSPTRHSIKLRYDVDLNPTWTLKLNGRWRNSEYPASSDLKRQDDLLTGSVGLNYQINKSTRLTSLLQWSSNDSSEDSYDYDKTLIKLGISLSF